MNKIFRAIAGIFLCGMLLTGGRASAADAEAMEIFRETVYATATIDNRIFNYDIFFMLPSTFVELDFIGGVHKTKFNMAGDFGFWMTADNGEVTEKEVPFYLAQDGDSMTFYFQDEKKKWKKMTAPVPAAQLADALATPDEQQLQEQIDSVKEVTVLSDTDSQRTLLVKLDGNKIADKILANMKIDANDPNAAMQQMFFNYIDTGIRNSDCWYTWTVNKNTWQTATLSANLSGLVQSIAQTVLNDTNNPLPAPIRDMLETVAFYSEFRVYTTYLSPEARSHLEIPKKVLKAKEVKDFNTEFNSDKKK